MERQCLALAFALGVSVSGQALADGNGTYSQEIHSESWTEQGANGRNYRFSVEWEGSINWSNNGYKRMDGRHCDWSYGGLRMTRNLYLVESTGRRVVATRTWHKSTLPGDSTKDNCNTVYLNVMIPAMRRETSAEKWRPEWTADREELRKNTANPARLAEYVKPTVEPLLQ